jgi:hypothetical protein
MAKYLRRIDGFLVPQKGGTITGTHISKQAPVEEVFDKWKRETERTWGKLSPKASLI